MAELAAPSRSGPPALLNFEQRLAAAAAVLLIVSTFGPFSFVEAGELLLAGGVLALLFARAEGRRFHLPFGDGTVIAAAGIWAGALIVARLFDRPLGQNLLALACAAILFLAGARERAKRPADDLPPEHETPPIRTRRPPRRPGAAAEATHRAAAAARVQALRAALRRAAASRAGRPGRRMSVTPTTAADDLQRGRQHERLRRAEARDHRPGERRAERERADLQPDRAS